MDASYLLMPFLYFPPFLLWAFESRLWRHGWIASSNNVIPIAAAITLSLYLSYPYAWFFLYFAAFVVVRDVALSRGISPISSLLLATYAVFSVAELWELPIHLSNWVTLDALAVGLLFSGFKLLAIALFFHKVVKQCGWRPSNAWLYGLAATIALGSILYSLYFPYSILNNTPPALAYALHLYRLPWLALFIGAIPKPSKHKLS